MIKHFTATGILVTGIIPKKILLGLHNKLNVWLPLGGHIEENENSTESVIREVLEETGFDVRPYIPEEKRLDDRVVLLLQPDYILEEIIPPHGETEAHAHLDLNYIFTVPEFVPVFPKREYKDMQWFTKEEALQLPTFVNIKEFYLPKVLK